MLRLMDIFFLRIGFNRDELCRIQVLQRAGLYMGMIFFLMIALFFLGLIFTTF